MNDAKQMLLSLHKLRNACGEQGLIATHEALRVAIITLAQETDNATGLKAGDLVSTPNTRTPSGRH